MTKAIITGTELQIFEREPLLAGSVNLNKIKLSFSGEWSQLTRQIDFKNEKSGESRRISAQMKTCTVPWEVLKVEGDVSCYIRGIGSDGKLKLRTNEVNLGTVLGASDETVPGTGTPTPNVCDETAAKLGDLGELKTSEKSEIVAAINEVKQTADSKQDKLIAGDNITIAADGKTISATGGAAGGSENAIKYFEVALTKQTDGSYTADKSFAQVKAELESGNLLARIVFEESPLLFTVVYQDSTQIVFGSLFMLDGGEGVVYFGVDSSDVWQMQVEQMLTFADEKELLDKLGNIYTLKTTDKSSVVAAINEVHDSVPTKTSQLENDSGYQTAEQVQTAVNAAVGVIENADY